MSVFVLAEDYNPCIRDSYLPAFALHVHAYGTLPLASPFFLASPLLSAWGFTSQLPWREFMQLNLRSSLLIHIYDS